MAMNGDSSLMVLLEIFSGQVKNLHTQLEQTLLRRMGLDPNVAPAQAYGKVQRAQLLPDKVQWRNGEVRMISVPMTVVCVKPQANLNLFVIEELTALESLALSIQKSIDSLNALQRETREVNLTE